MIRLTFALLALAIALPVAAQTPAPVANLEELVAASCDLEDAKDQWKKDEKKKFEAPYLALSPLGMVREREGFPLSEGQTLNIYVFGKLSVIEKLNVRRSSATRNADAFAIAGVASLDQNELTTARALLGSDECTIVSFELGDFAAPEGEIVLEAIDEADGIVKQIGSAYTFSVQSVFRGSVSFGPIASTFSSASYQVLTTGEGVSQLATTARNDWEVQYALVFTYYLRRPQTRGGGRVAYGPFLALPITGAFGDNAYAGFAIDLGTIFMGYVGVRLGKIDQLARAQEVFLVRDGDGNLPALPDGFSIATESTWEIGGAFGVSIDATAAAQAFGSIVKALGD
ncbi:MAG: hypothetical protein AAFP18_08320 [Bacteroidota bacterium]